MAMSAKGIGGDTSTPPRVHVSVVVRRVTAGGMGVKRVAGNREGEVSTALEMPAAINGARAIPARAGAMEEDGEADIV